jgi:hypothetical protein
VISEQEAQMIQRVSAADWNSGDSILNSKGGQSAAFAVSTAKSCP